MESALLIWRAKMTMAPLEFTLQHLGCGNIADVFKQSIRALQLQNGHMLPRPTCRAEHEALPAETGGASASGLLPSSGLSAAAWTSVQ